jgi:hypothetical protein
VVQDVFADLLHAARGVDVHDGLPGEVLIDALVERADLPLQIEVVEDLVPAGPLGATPRSPRRDVSTMVRSGLRACLLIP